uniref:Uncharacterized protein n=1 Tax=Salix viminalis TaxID=40686 RepID=A0A6N2KH05_SALVM
MEKLTALQDEFENVKTRLEVEREKALRLEKKILHLCLPCHFPLVNATEFSLPRHLVPCPELPLVSFQHSLPNYQILHCFVPMLDPLT